MTRVLARTGCQPRACGGRGSRSPGLASARLTALRVRGGLYGCAVDAAWARSAGSGRLLHEGRVLLEKGWGYSTWVVGSCSTHEPWPVDPHPRGVGRPEDGAQG